MKMEINNNFRFKKKFGQNFINDENVINNIVDKAEIDNETLVIEVGPGSGVLTSKLALKAKQVVAFEIDETLKPILDQKIVNNNVDIIYKDFLTVNLKDTLAKYTYQKIYFVANIPYYITTPIITKLIDEEIAVEKIVIMVQKEVADRFRAKPGTKDYNSLTVYLNYYFDITKLMDVSKNVFVPRPKVDSTVILLKRKRELKALNNKELFFKLVRDSFRQRRKMIRNNLREYNLDKVEQVLKEYNYDLTVRADMLTLDMYIEIANSL